MATANRASDIPPPLLDRLEVISLSGYTLVSFVVEMNVKSAINIYMCRVDKWPL